MKDVLKAEVWDIGTLQQLRNIDKVFSADMDHTIREKKYTTWKKAVKRTMGWLDNPD